MAGGRAASSRPRTGVGSRPCIASRATLVCLDPRHDVFVPRAILSGHVWKRLVRRSSLMLPRERQARLGRVHPVPPEHVIACVVVDVPAATATTAGLLSDADTSCYADDSSNSGNDETSSHSPLHYSPLTW